MSAFILRLSLAAISASSLFVIVFASILASLLEAIAPALTISPSRLISMLLFAITRPLLFTPTPLLVPTSLILLAYIPPSALLSRLKLFSWFLAFTSLYSLPLLEATAFSPMIFSSFAWIFEFKFTAFEMTFV